MRQGDTQVPAMNVGRAPLRLPTQICLLYQAQGKHLFTNGVLKASEFADVGGARVPMKISIVYNAATNAATVFCRYAFSVTNAQARCSLTSFKPALPRGANVVQDWRFSHGPG